MNEKLPGDNIISPDTGTPPVSTTNSSTGIPPLNLPPSAPVRPPAVTRTTAPVAPQAPGTGGVPDWAIRALRTAIQTFLTTLLMQWGALHLAPGTLPSWDTAKVVLIAAVVAAAVALFTAVQNAFEQSAGVNLLPK